MMIDIGPKFYSAIPQPRLWSKGQGPGFRNFMLKFWVKGLTDHIFHTI